MSRSNSSGTISADSLTLTTLRVVGTQQSATAAMPLTFGVDLPRGRVQDAKRLHLSAADGQSQPIQATPLTRWSDGSVKWVLIDTVLNGHDREDADLVLRSSDGAAVESEFFNAESLAIQVDGRSVFATRGSASARIRFQLKAGKEIEPRITKREVEVSGSVRRTERFEGAFPGMRGLRFVCRISTRCDTGLIRLTSANMPSLVPVQW